MTIFGVDIHPQYQAGISIEQIRAEGFDFLSVKVSEGTDDSYLAAGSADWLVRGAACGLATMAYHYLRPGGEAAQARVFADALHRTGAPGALDAEAIDPAGNPTLTIAGIRAFVAAASSCGAPIALMYLPHWYWEELGQPNLAGLPPLWASSYPTTTQGYASQIYADLVTDRATSWNGYGNNRVEALQFADTGLVAGRVVDVNAYRGTHQQLTTLVHPNTPTPQPGQHRERHDMDQLPPTPAPADPDSDPATWPQTNRDIGFDLAGGWEGDYAFEVGVQEWSGRTKDAARGFLSLASWITPTGLVPVDPVFTAAGGGQVIQDHAPTRAFVAPRGATGLTVNYAAPGGAYVASGRSA